MKTFTRPKIFRSTEGCCICKAKSSRYFTYIDIHIRKLTLIVIIFSSRFTDSERYEDDLEACFQLCGERRGEICNACVLVVKRWRKMMIMIVIMIMMMTGGGSCPGGAGRTGATWWTPRPGLGPATIGGGR